MPGESLQNAKKEEAWRGIQNSYRDLLNISTPSTSCSSSDLLRNNDVDVSSNGEVRTSNSPQTPQKDRGRQSQAQKEDDKSFVVVENRDVLEIVAQSDSGDKLEDSDDGDEDDDEGTIAMKCVDPKPTLQDNMANIEAQSQIQEITIEKSRYAAGREFCFMEFINHLRCKILDFNEEIKKLEKFLENGTILDEDTSESLSNLSTKAVVLHDTANSIISFNGNDETISQCQGISVEIVTACKTLRDSVSKLQGSLEIENDEELRKMCEEVVNDLTDLSRHVSSIPLLERTTNSLKAVQD